MEIIQAMLTAEPVLFPRPARAAAAQKTMRRARQGAIDTVHQQVSELDGEDLGTFLTELADRRVLILGRFTRERKPILEAIRSRLRRHQGRYIPTVFDFARPAGRDLGESILLLAYLSRFAIADLTDPKSVPAELVDIVKNCPSLPVVPILLEDQKEYALYENIRRYPWVIDPPVCYRDKGHLLQVLDQSIVEPAEAMVTRLREPGRRF